MPTNAIVTWFYPGRNSGQEFVYSRAEGQELARAKHQTVMAMDSVNTEKVVTGNSGNAQTVVTGD